MERSELEEDRAYHYGSNSRSPLRDAFGPFYKTNNSSSFATVHYPNQVNPGITSKTHKRKLFAKTPSKQ